MNAKESLIHDPIPRLLWRIAVPASTGMFLNTLFNLVDTYYAGKLSADALAGLALSFPIFFFLIAISSGLMQGAIALLANRLGAGDVRAARHLFAQSVFLTLATGIVTTWVGLSLTRWCFIQLGAQGASLEEGVAFMDAIFCGAVFFFLVATLNAPLAAQGDSRTNRNFLLFGLVANCILNPLFMWGWGWIPPLGVSGIALATVLVQVGGCVGLGWKVAKSETFARLPVRYFVPNTVLLRQLASQSIPAILNMSTIALGIMVITRFVQYFGTEAVAAIGIASRIEQIVLMPVIGLSTAVLSLTGQNHGAGKHDRVRFTWLSSVGSGVAIMLVGGVALYLIKSWALRIFTADSTIITLGNDYLTCAALTLAAYPILFSTVFLMQGLKRPAYGLWVGLYRQVAAPVLVFPLLAFHFGWGLWGIFLGVCLINWSAALFALAWGWHTVRPVTPLFAVLKSPVELRENSFIAIP